jgi:hypothetical protein
MIITDTIMFRWAFISCTEQVENIHGLLDVDPVLAELVAAMMYWSVAEQAFWTPSCDKFRLKSENLQLILMSYRYLEINTTRRVPLVEQELLTLPEHLSSPSVFSFMCMFYRSLFVLLYFFFWPLCCLFFFNLQIQVTPLVSSDSCSDNNGSSVRAYESYCRFIIKNEEQKYHAVRICFHLLNY